MIPITAILIPFLAYTACSNLLKNANTNKAKPTNEYYRQKEKRTRYEMKIMSENIVSKIQSQIYDGNIYIKKDISGQFILFIENKGTIANFDVTDIIEEKIISIDNNEYIEEYIKRIVCSYKKVCKEIE